MTTRKHLKRRARSRAARTGESYATALRMIRARQENRMSSSTNGLDTVLAACSFCGKPDAAVQRLVAGPGVYICDECIQLSVSVLQQAAQITPEEAKGRRSEYVDRPSAEILALLPALVKSVDRVENELAGWVRRLRERGTGWPAIAEATGMDVDAAQQRFRPES
jgi:hypothetical protein